MAGQFNPGDISYGSITYWRLRRTVGWIGILLPVVLLLGNKIFEDKVQNSVSAYYYTGMRDVFVGALCVVGVFLLCDKGDGKKGTPFFKTVAAWYFVAGILALLVPLLPTTREVPPGPPLSGQEIIVGKFHGGSAIFLFVLLGLISIFIFTRPDKNFEYPNHSIDVTGKWTAKWKVILCIYIPTGFVITFVVGIFNGIYATVLFVLLSLIYYLVTHFKFNKGNSGKFKRNSFLYIPSGVFILYCVLSIVFFFPVQKFKSILGFPPGLFFESSALFWFGVCWLSKGSNLTDYKVFGIKIISYFND